MILPIKNCSCGLMLLRRKADGQRLRSCFSSQSGCSMVPPAERRKPMKNTIARLAGALIALTRTTGLAAAQSKVTIAIGGGSCLCYLPTVLAKQLGEYDKAGLNVELVDLKGGSDALKAVLGGSADVVSGYFDHCVNLAAKKQELQAFVVYDRYPGLVLVVSPALTNEIKSIKDLAVKKVGVSATNTTTNFFRGGGRGGGGRGPAGAAGGGGGGGAAAGAAGGRG